MTRVIIAGFVALLGTAGAIQPAGAVALVDTRYSSAVASLTVNGEIFSITGCQSSLCNSLQMVQDGSDTGIMIETLSRPGSDAILSETTSWSNQNMSTNLGLTVSVTGNAQISDIQTSVTGNTPGYSDNGAVGASGSMRAGGTTLQTGSADLNTPGDTSMPSGFTTVDITNDMHIYGRNAPVAGTMKLTGFKTDIICRKIPEPASVMMLLVGLSASAVAWRRRRRG